MPKFLQKVKLSADEREHLLFDFFKALASVKNPSESAQVITDLLSPAEADMVAKRLAIGRALLSGENYQAIIKKLKVSTNTIARVNAWLQESGEGFRLIFKRLGLGSYQDKKKNFSGFTSLKRSYPQYFWPEAVVENILLSATKKQQQELLSIIRRSKNKTRLLRQIDKIFKNGKYYHTL